MDKYHHVNDNKLQDNSVLVTPTATPTAGNEVHSLNENSLPPLKTELNNEMSHILLSMEQSVKQSQDIINRNLRASVDLINAATKTFSPASTRSFPDTLQEKKTSSENSRPDYSSLDTALNVDESYAESNNRLMNHFGQLNNLLIAPSVQQMTNSINEVVRNIHHNIAAQTATVAQLALSKQQVAGPTQGSDKVVNKND